MICGIKMKKVNKKKSDNNAANPIAGTNIFREATLSIYLLNWIKETDPERYNKMVCKAEEEEKKIEDGRKGEMAYAKSVLLETMLDTPQGQKLLEDMTEIFWFPDEILPAFKLIAKEYGLHIDFEDIYDHDVRYYDKEGNILDSNGKIKRTKIQRESFSNRKYILEQLETLDLNQLETVLDFIKKIKNEI